MMGTFDRFVFKSLHFPPPPKSEAGSLGADAWEG